MRDPHNLVDSTDCQHNLVMGKLKDSLLFQLATFNPSISINSGHASFIEQRLQQLFDSFQTPTHPPYALMIQRAITELNEETGSTEEAISEFIKREYEDLPWAHVRILDLHLRKLCQDGELACTKNGRYVLLVDCGRMGDGEDTECKGSKKSSSGDRGRNGIVESGEAIERDNGMQELEIKEQTLAEWRQEQVEVHWQSTERAEEQGNSEKQLLGVVEELEQQSQLEWQGTGVTEEHTEAEKYQGQMAQAQSEAELLQKQEAIMELKDKTVSRKLMNKEPYQTNAEQDLIIGKQVQDGQQRQGLEDHHYCEEQNGVHDELNELSDQRTEVIQEQNNEALVENQNHIQQMKFTNKMSGFGSDEKTSDVNLSVSHGGPTTAVIPEGNLAGIKLSLMHKPSATDVVAEPKMTDSLSYVDVLEHRLERHLDVGSPRCELDENPMSRDPEQLPPKNRRRGRPPKLKLGENTTFGDLEQPPLKHRCRGRPPNPKPVTDNPGESLLPSDDGILNEQKANIFKTELQQPQPCGQGRGRGRPRKLNINAHQCKEQLQPQEQAQGLVNSPYSEPKETIYSSQPTALNLAVNLTLNSEQQLVASISEGSPGCITSTGIELSPTQLQMQMPSDVNLSGHPAPMPPKRPRRGRPPKIAADYPGEALLPSEDSILNEQKPVINKMERQLQHGRGRGRGMSRGRGRGRGRGRPPKQN